MSRHSSPSPSDDDLFDPQNGRPTNFETVETVPLHHPRASPELETLASLPVVQNGQNTQRRGLSSQSQFRYLNGPVAQNTYQTQPTQLLDVPSELSSSPTNPVVHVTASSPTAAPAPPMRRPTGILASAMAPAGTAFRRPYVAPAVSRQSYNISIDSEEDEHGASSDSDRAEQARNNIKPSTFRRAADKVPESPQSNAGLSRFQQITQGSLYRGTDYATGSKRSSDIMANAYGSVSKKPRQTGPSRAILPPAADTSDSDMELDDITDFNARSKVRRMRGVYPAYKVKDMYKALQAKKGNFDDAVEHLMLLSEQTANKNGSVVDMLGSEDELMMTPAVNRSKGPAATVAPVVQDTRQQAKKPTKTINEKWSSTQAIAKKASQNKKLEVFEDPGPAPSKPRKLMRGRRDPSPSSQRSAKSAEVVKSQAAIVISDGSGDEADSGVHSEPEDGDFDDRLLSFFNTCSAMDLSDTASITRDIAEHLVSKRPFKSLDAVNRVESPNLKPSKSRRKAPPLGEKIVEKVDAMLRSYEAVDYLVQKCESIAKPLTSEMKSWGVDMYGKEGSGELDMTQLQPDPKPAGSSLDSGLGTPISDDDRDHIRGPGMKKLVGQPASMAEGITMKDYQVVGLNWLNLLFRKRYSCILADDMGLGKTLQTIAFLAHLAETGIKGPSLIVVPAATLENWLKEFARFCPGLAVEPYYAPNPTERFVLRNTIDEMRDEINVIITTYTIAKAKDDFPWLKNFGFCCTIFDEGHVLKNADSKVSRSLMRINSKWRLLLTGTPLQNNLKELMSLLFFLMPDIFKSKQEELAVIFKQDVKTINEDAESREMLLSKKRITRARSMLTPFILRRKKWQVLKDLPKKERKVEYCHLTEAQTNIYNGWLAKAFDIRERRANGERIGGDESSNILMKLRQAAIHPLLFRHRYSDGDLRKIAKACLKDPQWEASNPDLIFTELLAYSDFEVHQLCVKSKPLQKFMLTSHDLHASGKVQVMIRLLKQFIAEGHRVLIFSQFVMVLDILELILGDQGITFFRLDGSTKVSERQDLIDEFNEEIDESDPDAAVKRAEQVPVFMLSTKAGGAGINLASASRVIVFDSGFNPQDDVQAENRAHRIGQKKAVEVWRLVTKGTVEEQIHGMGEVKLRLDREVAGEGAEGGEDDSGSGSGGKQADEKENEGRLAVEEMFFKNLETSPRKLTATAHDGSPSGTGVVVDENNGLGNTKNDSRNSTDHRHMANSISEPDHNAVERKRKSQINVNNAETEPEANSSQAKGSEDTSHSDGDDDFPARAGQRLGTRSKSRPNDLRQGQNSEMDEEDAEVVDVREKNIDLPARSRRSKTNSSIKPRTASQRTSSQPLSQQKTLSRSNSSQQQQQSSSSSQTQQQQTKLNFARLPKKLNE